MFDRFVLSLAALRQLETLYPVQFICFYKYVTGNVLRSFIAFIFVDSTRVTLHDSNQGFLIFLSYPLCFDLLLHPVCKKLL